MLGEMLVQEIQDLKTGGYALGEVIQHLRKRYGAKAPSVPTVRKYYGMDGVPDRMVMLPHGRIGFVEVKAPGESPRPLQTHRHRQLRALGFPVFVLDDAEKIPWILKEVAAWRM